MVPDMVIDPLVGRSGGARFGTYRGTLDMPGVRIHLFERDSVMSAVVGAARYESAAQAVSPYETMLEEYAASRGCRLRLYMT